MFEIIDRTNKNPISYKCNDIKTASDIILGLTGNESDVYTATCVMGYMRHFDSFINKRFAIFCFDENINKGE